MGGSINSSPSHDCSGAFTSSDEASPDGEVMGLTSVEVATVSWGLASVD